MKSILNMSNTEFQNVIDAANKVIEDPTFENVAEVEKALGKEPEYKSKEDFLAMMRSDEPFVL